MSGSGPRTISRPLGAAVLLLGGVAFAPAAADMTGRWLATDSYYAHGPLVPLVCAFLVWRERDALGRAPRSPSWLGVGGLAAAIGLLAASLLLDVHFTQGIALVGAALGVTLAMFGGAVVARCWTAFAFALFMVPLPQVAVVHLTFELKMIAAGIAVAVMGIFTPAVRDGSMIHLPDASFVVDDACSGLRALIGLLAFAAVFASVERSRSRAALTLALALPIAVAANVGRILALCWLAGGGHPVAPGETLHDLTGIGVYVIAFALLLGLRAALGGARGRAEEAGEPAPAPADHRAPGGAIQAAVLALLAAGAIAAIGLTATQPPPAETDRTRSIPGRVGSWTGADIALTERTYEILGTRDVLMRRYVHEARGPVDLYVVHAADRRKVAHPPEICLSGGGYTTRSRTIETLRVGERAVECNRIVLDHGSHRLLVYYWYRLDGKDTPSYLDHQLGSLLGRLRGERREGSMVRLSTGVPPGGELAEADARVRAFVAEALAIALEPIP